MERQGRVAAEDYDIRRGLQQFRVVRADRVPAGERGLIEHPRSKRRANAAAWHCLLHLGASRSDRGVEVTDDA
ncbi:MAG: hypothetical protein QM674_21860 [Burkholderiaceae bacterium]